MGQMNFVPDQSFGYVQIPAASVNAGVNIANYVFANNVLLGAAGKGIADGPWRLIIVAEAQAWRWRDDGTAASATVGEPMAVGQPLTYDGTGLASLTAFSQVAGCILNVWIGRARSS